MIIIRDVEQGSAEWKEMRLGKITASRMHEVMSNGKGGNPSKMSETYMIELITEKLTGKPKDFFENDAMRWGTKTEPMAREVYYVKNDFAIVEEVAFIELNDYVGVSPDGLIGEDGMLEIKAPTTQTQIKRALSADFSADYKAQIQAQLWVSGRDWCDFVSYDPRIDCKSSFLQVRVFRDNDYIKIMEEKVTAFTLEMKSKIEML